MKAEMKAISPDAQRLIQALDVGSRASAIEFVRRYFELSGVQDQYYFDHVARYAETMAHVPAAKKEHGRALELGSTRLFQELLRAVYGYDEVHGTHFDPSTSSQPYYREFSVLSDRKWYMTHNCNIEDAALPFDDGYLDFVMCCEVIEHMECDPMHLISEMNRVLTPGGQLLITTPNSASGRVLWSILNGYRPHFFMQYPKDRSLYKHNFEYDVSSLRLLLESGGMEVLRMTTIDTFAEAVPQALAVLSREGFPTSDRGDNIYALCRKVGPVTERYPQGIYY